MSCNSTLAPYALPADFLLRVDPTIPGLLSRDDQTMASPADLLVDDVLFTALMDASGAVESQCLIARRYSPTDLQSLVGASQDLLKRIVCGLAIQFLRERRGIMEPSYYPIYQQSLKWMDAIADGSAIFALTGTEDAGLPTVQPITANDLFFRTPSLWTNNIRAFGIRQNRRGLGNSPGNIAF